MTGAEAILRILERLAAQKSDNAEPEKVSNE